MGSVVKAITKPFKSVAKALTGGSAAPQVITQTVPAPTPTQAAVAQPTVVQQQGEAETLSGESSERVKRRGKKSLTIRRTNIGGGSGLNV